LLGPNAMALPSGTVIVTDQLLELSDVDDEIIAVLAHETGHVEGRHGLRALFQSSIVALGATWFLGDVNVLIATAPTTLMQAKYSRDLEREADDHAVAVLMLNGIPTGRLVRMLERLDESGDKRGSASGSIAERYLSTHPVTAERVARLRGMR
jgi:Zn-dependent protease with chaperone function